MSDVRGARQHMAAFLGVPVDDLRDDTPLRDVVVESFVLLQLVIELQDVCEARIRAEHLAGVVTVGDLLGAFTVSREPDLEPPGTVG